MIHPIQLEMMSIQLSLEKQKNEKLTKEVEDLKQMIKDLVTEIFKQVK
jgi:cell division protein FtsB